MSKTANKIHGKNVTANKINVEGIIYRVTNIVNGKVHWTN